MAGFIKKFSFLLFAILFIANFTGCQLFVQPTTILDDCNVPELETIDAISKGRMFYLLVSGKENYQKYRQEISTSILPVLFYDILKPNDTIIMSWIEADAENDVGDSGPLINSVVAIPIPEIETEVTPQLVLTYTPDPGLIPGPKKDRIEDEIQKIDKANTATVIQHRCQTVVPHRLTQQAVIDSTRANQNKKINEVILSVQEKITSGTNYQVGTLEALKLASSIVQDACGDNSKYSECTILMFSNMEDVNGLKDKSIDFSYSHLTLILLNCNFWISQCKTTKDNFSQSHTPKSICFISAQATVPTLIDYLRSKKCNR